MIEDTLEAKDPSRDDISDYVIGRCASPVWRFPGELATTVSSTLAEKGKRTDILHCYLQNSTRHTIRNHPERAIKAT